MNFDKSLPYKDYRATRAPHGSGGAKMCFWTFKWVGLAIVNCGWVGGGGGGGYWAFTSAQLFSFLCFLATIL